MERGVGETCGVPFRRRISWFLFSMKRFQSRVGGCTSHPKAAAPEGRAEGVSGACGGRFGGVLEDGGVWWNPLSTSPEKCAPYVMSFFGTHPTLTQVPPRGAHSTTATFAPCVAAIRDVLTPPLEWYVS